MANCLHPAVFRLFPHLIQVVFLQGKSLEFLAKNSGWQNAERPKNTIKMTTLPPPRRLRYNRLATAADPIPAILRV